MEGSGKKQNVSCSTALFFLFFYAMYRYVELVYTSSSSSSFIIITDYILIYNVDETTASIFSFYISDMIKRWFDFSINAK